jgi:hypothetical protein
VIRVPSGVPHESPTTGQVVSHAAAFATKGTSLLALGGGEHSIRSFWPQQSARIKGFVLAPKDEVLAELMEEHVTPKIEIGEL